MIESSRNFRIQFRCTESEKIIIEGLAKSMNLSVTNLIRDSLLISTYTCKDRNHWDKVVVKSICNYKKIDPLPIDNN